MRPRNACTVSCASYGPISVASISAASLALNAALPQCHHKDVLAILYGHDGKREKVLRFYAIKQQSKPVYRRNPETLLTEAMRPLYAALLMETKVHGFDPVEPWRWTPGADVVGIDRTLIGGAE